MPCERINNGFICSNSVKKIDGYIVEFPPIGSPVALKPNGEIYKRIPGGWDRFYRAIAAHFRDVNKSKENS